MHRHHPTPHACNVMAKDTFITYKYSAVKFYIPHLYYNTAFIHSYGEIHPQNWKERLTALICMIVECTKLSVILGNLAALLTFREIKAGSFRYHLKVVQEHMVKLLCKCSL